MFLNIAVSLNVYSHNIAPLNVIKIKPFFVAKTLSRHRQTFQFSASQKIIIIETNSTNKFLIDDLRIFLRNLKQISPNLKTYSTKIFYFRGFRLHSRFFDFKERVKDLWTIYENNFTGYKSKGIAPWRGLINL